MSVPARTCWSFPFSTWTEMRCPERPSTWRTCDPSSTSIHFIVEQVQERRSDIWIFLICELWTLLDNGYARSEATKRLRQFQANISAADHDEVFGQTVEVEGLHMGHRLGFSQSGNSGNRGP